MANWDILKSAIAGIIKTNCNQEITGQLLQNVLNNIVSSVGENATFAGIATPTTNPGAPDGPVFYLAAQAGEYANFSGITVLIGEAVILEWSNGVWSKKTSGFVTQESFTKLESEVDKKITNVIVQETGDGERVVMSQKAVTEKIGSKFNISEIGDEVSLSHFTGWELGTLYLNSVGNISYDTAPGMIRLAQGVSIKLPSCHLILGNNIKSRIIKVTADGYETIHNFTPYISDFLLEKGEYILALGTIDGSIITNTSAITDMCIIVNPNNTTTKINTFNNRLIFNNDERKVYNDGSYEYLSISSNGSVTVIPFSFCEYGAVGGASSNIALVYNSEGVLLKQSYEIDYRDVILALFRVQFGDKNDDGLFNYIIDHISYCPFTYTLISGGRIIDYNSSIERGAMSSLVNDRKVDMSSLISYKKIFTPSMQVYGSGSHFRIPVLPGFYVKIVASSSTTSTYAFLKDVSSLTPIEGAVRNTLKKNEVVHVLIPDGCYALYVVNINGAGEDETPAEVTLENFYSANVNATQLQCYSVGNLLFDNVSKTISVIYDRYVIVPKKDGTFRLIEISDIPYGTLDGKNGFGAIAVKNDGMIIVDNYDNLSLEDSIVAVFRVNFEKRLDSGRYEFNVKYIAYSTLDCKVRNAPAYKTLDNIPYYGDKLNLQPTLQCRAYGKDIFEPYPNGKAAQGMAIYNGYMFQLHNEGMVRVWDIRKTNPILINEFDLGSAGDTNHANSAQFDKSETDTGFPLLYVGGCVASKREMYVEKISLSGSDLLQIISFDETIQSIPNTNQLSCIIGDDGFIWVNNHDGDKAYFTKLRKPSIEEGNITLSQEDVVDSWAVDYDHYNETRQDISVYNGKLFFEYGGTHGMRGVKIFDTSTHRVINNINLTDYVSAEFEGMDIYECQLWISTIENVAYILNF